MVLQGKMLLQDQKTANKTNVSNIHTAARYDTRLCVCVCVCVCDGKHLQKTRCGINRVPICKQPKMSVLKLICVITHTPAVFTCVCVNEFINNSEDDDGDDEAHVDVCLTL